jgi:hypothetical protein
MATCDELYVQPKEMPFCLARLMTIGTWRVSGKNDVFTRDGKRGRDGANGQVQTDLDRYLKVSYMHMT